jgi:hypothetical protein
MTAIRRNPRTAWREYDGIALVITPDDRMVHQLNETGAFLWRTLGTGSMSIDALADALVREFDIKSVSAREDVCRWVETSCGRGLCMREENSVKGTGR